MARTVHKTQGKARAKREAPGAREQIKLAARRLFAIRGIDGVSVREIVEAAEQKNHGSLAYYFGTKEALVRELVADGAKLIDMRRNAFLDKLEKDGGPHSVREVVEALVYPSIGLAGERENEEDTYTRFIATLAMNHRDLFMDALEKRWNSGYLRALEHLRRLMPDMPAAAKNQRFVFMGAYLGSVLSLREAALTDRTRAHPTWGSPDTLPHFVQTMTVMLEEPLEKGLFAGAARRATKPRSIVGSIGMILD
ncbi:MAG: helix-turn-helix domain containing protein [Parvibaculum sp.]|jgi:AcrR family transcriptional regulator|uniref:TetR/AcrR family transcriptional regulator n=1 Tax=Parvibaculum sp. TaxID=2024848 RepID=UPI0028409522|nr:helix-turn-helix domain-containing protein [Parvibaculum sp.]MDR3499742.1 helix-turn-helix domain containing protein [Parvibaculum sp.]